MRVSEGWWKNKLSRTFADVRKIDELSMSRM